MTKINWPGALLALIFMFGAAFSSWGEDDQQKQKKNSNISKEIQKIVFDDSVYWGDARVEMKGDDYEKKAYTDAITNLSSQVRVKVSSVMTEVLGREAGKDSEMFEKNMQAKTVELLEDVEKRRFENYPENGQFTMVVFMKKDVIKKRIADQKYEIVELITTALDFKKKNMHIPAIKNFLDADARLNAYFGSLPVEADVYNTGKEEVLNIIIKNYLQDYVQAVKLRLLNKGPFVYDTNGNLKKYPLVGTIYAPNDGTETPIGRIPLLFSNEKGACTVDAHSLFVPDGGESVLKISGIDASNPETSLRLSIDLEKMGFAPDFAVTSPVSIEMTRAKSIAYCVKSSTGSFSIAKSLEKIITGSSYTPVHYEIQEEHPDFSNIIADYFILVTFEGGREHSQEYELYKAYLSSRYEIYSLPGGNLIVSDELDSEKGMGISASQAKSRAFEKINRKLLSRIEAEIGKLK